MPKFNVVREQLIEAPAQRVYETLADYQTWSIWSPWLISDPQARVTVSTPPNQVGSQYAWEGPVTGSGELQHQELVPERSIRDELRFIKPFRSTCQTGFSLESRSNGTLVRWDMQASLPWFLFFMVPAMKTFIGMDYARGLAMLKELLEQGSIQSRCEQRGQLSVPAIRMAGVPGRAAVDQVGEAMEGTFQAAERAFATQGLTSRGPAISVYTRFDVKRGTFDYLSGYLISPETNLAPHSGLQIWSAPAGKAWRVDHYGPYHHLGNGWSVANQTVRHAKLKQCRTGTYEIYRSDPSTTPPAEILTEIYLPLK